MPSLPRPCVCLVTSRRRTSPYARTEADEIAGLERMLDDAIDAGIDLIQIRERDLQARQLLELSRRVAARTAGTGTRVVVNDRADVALAVSYVGVHLRSDGPDPGRVRGLTGERLLGQSIHLPCDHLSNAPDYFMFGTVFPSDSKHPDAPVAGLAGLVVAAQATSIPVLAIGGVTPERAVECVDAGASGVAAIGAFLPAGSGPDTIGTRRAVAAFRESFSRAF